MFHRIPLLIWYGCLMAFQSAPPQSFVLCNGNLCQVLAPNKLRQLTFNGTYMEVSLSPDGARLAALRKNAGDEIAIEVFSLPWNSPSPVATIKGPVVVEEHRLPIEGKLMWPNDGNALYYLLYFSSTSAYLARTDRKTMETKGLCPAIDFIIIRKGE